MTSYVAKQPSASGLYEWTTVENAIWQKLMQLQKPLLKTYACEEFMAGLATLGLDDKQIPQLESVSAKLRRTTGWSVEAVPALISFGRFFELLANRQFPVATFIRSEDDLTYLQEPDIFHEILGHCPLLTNNSYAAFTHAYGQIGNTATKEQRTFMARLYWFTIEFGLIRSGSRLKAYGGGILSSPKETVAAIESKDVLRVPFDPVEVLRTDYRIDRLQQIYFVIDDMSELDSLLDPQQLFKWIEQAKELGVKPYKESA